MAFARIVTHYFHHHAWLEDGILLREAHRLASIPGVLIHGRLDLGNPAVAAWELAQAWPDAKLDFVGTGPPAVMRWPSVLSQPLMGSRLQHEEKRTGEIWRARRESNPRSEVRENSRASNHGALVSERHNQVFRNP